MGVGVPLKWHTYGLTSAQRMQPVVKRFVFMTSPIAICSQHFIQTYTSIMLFIFAMLLHPDAQKMAQEEIDRVVGRSRLPDFSDRESLSVVECVMQETFRWQPPVPLGILFVDYHLFQTYPTKYL